jgi:hypothetical protein
MEDMMDFVEENNLAFAENNPYGPILELITYDLSKVGDFATPQDFSIELAGVNS